MTSGPSPCGTVQLAGDRREGVDEFAGDPRRQRHRMEEEIKQPEIGPERPRGGVAKRMERGQCPKDRRDNRRRHAAMFVAGVLNPCFPSDVGQTSRREATYLASDRLATLWQERG